MDGRSRGRTPAATASRRLAGNVGYLKTKSFYGPDIAGRRDDALATTDSLIVDVRENRSGDPMAVALLISHGDSTKWTPSWMSPSRVDGP
ncbi:hypothetical protein [Amycolatopsis sp. WAC 01416]|uniref:hypothetical protein n=1 Tax=Amycolatopsis sp. WAC 01416 TaxID=2203196 RepID=UPI001F3F8E9A|nr:hypothetical protein [Amycolatopsis sp. WAC 01416]